MTGGFSDPACCHSPSSALLRVNVDTAMDGGLQPTPDVISDVTTRRHVPSTPHQAELAADVAHHCRFTVGPDDAFPLPPSPLVQPKNSSSGNVPCALISLAGTKKLVGS